MEQELYCRGVKLNPSPEYLGELRDSSNILSDADALKARMDEEGYLFFPGLIEREKVLKARREILLKYATIGEIDSINHDVMDSILQKKSFIGNVNLVAFTESIRRGAAYEDLTEDIRIMNVYEKLLGGPVRTFEFKWPRFVRPGEGTGIHSDNIYVTGGTQNVWTTWIPIGDVALEEGPIVLLEKSHKSPKLTTYWGKDADKDKVGWLSENPTGVQKSIGGRWLTGNFKAGDILCFDVRLVHASLDNRSSVNRCRLTSDTRYQLQSDPLDERWYGGNLNPHGGQMKVFLPGMARQVGNRKFEEEWKPVDEFGRLDISAVNPERLVTEE
ncbi:phytanoyl-CoA dioxygenase family protein [Gynuella sunshinyii]|uniref:Protein involved in biosynthesis of mitomycin antibiotics/polyketide fumonisin n=1 Tax=Gynuella sunshinyii YC6258 TaxID=1445510 RepID=A0A0C5VUG1_9GAMM|nr:phytanoyl-CoA dioxygenase family protein [Gynuella sunshinyii]AJQ97781.1 protein involved in biosynthesis of mitomycin antibiotics/polyketide fumonisin [Gynuella sunshinyii YC6258]